MVEAGYRDAPEVDADMAIVFVKVTQALHMLQRGMVALWVCMGEGESSLV